MTKYPKVSVLIPTYNYAHHLDEAIRSVLSQTFTDFELIIVDDNSSDNTDEVIKKYLVNSQVYYYKNQVNLGLSENFNKSLGYAKGEYIKYLLADDKLHPKVLEKFVEVMERDPNISLVTSNSEMFGSSSRIRIQPYKYFQPGKKIINTSLQEKNGNWIGEPSVVMFRRADLRIGQFNNDYTCLVDWDMWLRLLTIGDCYIVPEILSYFRSHEKQASRQVMENYNFTFEDYRFYKSIEKNNPYGADLAVLNIKKIISKKAIYCADAMFKLLPELTNKKQREIFLKAFKIAYAEKVIFKSFYKQIKGFYKKVTRKSTKPDLALNN